MACWFKRKFHWDGGGLNIANELDLSVLYHMHLYELGSNVSPVSIPIFYFVILALKSDWGTNKVRKTENR